MLTIDADTLMAQAKSDGVKAECRKVYEAIRYSDPMSNDALASVEGKISAKFAELSAKVAELEAKPAATPAHQEFSGSPEPGKTGNKGLDRLARIAAAK